MTKIQKYIQIEQFADFHQVTTSLILEFADFGLVQIVHVEQQPCISHEELDRMERIIRLHNELGVNKEGIAIILEMREKQEALQLELKRLKHLARKYETQLFGKYSDDFFDAD